MTTTEVWRIVQSAFAASPYLAAVIALLFWLGFSWKYRLVAIGRKKSLPSIILDAFALGVDVQRGQRLATLAEVETLVNPTPAGAASHSDSCTHAWKVGEVYLIYWIIIARGQVIRYTSLLVLFAAGSLAVMKLAQPRESVSLLNVANFLGVWTLLPLAVLSLLSFVLLICSAHQLPCSGIKEHKPGTIIPFAW